MEFKTTRLNFERFSQSQFDDYRTLVTNNMVMQLIAGKAYTEEEASLHFQKLLDVNTRNPELGYFRICTIAQNQFIGLGKIVMIQDNEAEIGYSLLPGFWGKGYGSEISKELVSRAFSFDFIHSLMAIIDPENQASRKILLKSNFKLVETCELDGLPAEIYRLFR